MVNEDWGIYNRTVKEEHIMPIYLIRKLRYSTFKQPNQKDIQLTSGKADIQI